MLEANNFMLWFGWFVCAGLLDSEIQQWNIDFSGIFPLAEGKERVENFDYVIFERPLSSCYINTESLRKVLTFESLSLSA